MEETYFKLPKLRISNRLHGVQALKNFNADVSGAVSQLFVIYPMLLMKLFFREDIMSWENSIRLFKANKILAMHLCKLIDLQQIINKRVVKLLLIACRKP